MPSDSDWKEWESFLKCIQGEVTSKIKNELKLGSWQSMHLKWQWMTDGYFVQDTDENVTYSQVEHCCLDAIYITDNKKPVHSWVSPAIMKFHA